jgi:NAD(P)-dependent dehydrogenase (short-subunit alcohol dehydrogenase family)
MIAYSASKSAVASITQSLAIELQTEGILVNAVVPSIMDTPANRRSMPGADFSGWPKVEQVAQTIAFLASEQNALTSGVLLPVYGRA